MATLVLTAAVASSGLSGFALFAANLAAAAVGTFIDNRLFGVSQNQQSEGPRLSEMQVSTSSEGQPIKRLYGRARIGGNLIWTTNFKETKNTSTEKVGGKGGGKKSTVTTTTYTYSISCAFAFTEGNDRCRIGRIWVDNKLFDTNGVTYRFYPGSQTQGKDSKIVAVEGANNVSAYRGVSYIVFENLELEKFGNRIPQITAEIIVPINNPSADIMENLIQAVNMIPATGEVAYSTTPSIKDDGFGNAIAENIHLKADETDIELSVEDLVSQMPNAKRMNLVISWFGNDLRMNNCEIEPRVEVNQNKVLQPIDWNVGGLNRSTANQVSQINVNGENRPAFGGTPSDHSVVEAIQYLCDGQGIDVLFYPFLLMDIPAGNGLPDPYGGAEQAVYPWRGRITTSSPATVDKTATAQTEIDAFFGSVTAGDFSVSGTTVTYTGSPSDKGCRRMILHYAHLFAAAINTLTVKSRGYGFYVGTEMRGITQTRRNGTGVYPGVTKFSDLINDVKAIFNAAGLSSVRVSYAADWSEYHSHRPTDGTNDVFFNMDPLWTNSNCAYVAIDNYVPVSDWRDGVSHSDYGSGNDVYGNPKSTSIYDKNYLQGQIEGGEGYDYFYLNDSDRTNQVRTAITDGAHGKPWVFRQKDFRSWWSNQHFNRPGGVQSGSPTSWTAGLKKIVFSEYGSSAVDKGTNQPNVFYDPKSSESFLPYFSSGQRDDTLQRAYYEALILYWRDNAPTISSVKMIDPSDMYAWTWDARPFPAFPYRTDFWSDGENWQLGHWLNGRVGVVPLGELVKIICGWVGFTDEDIDVTGLVGTNTIVRGYPIDSIMSPREALNPLFSAYLFDGFESQGKIKFLLRANTPFSPLDIQDFISTRENPSGYQLNRAQETELPAKSILSYMDETKDYQVGTVGTQRQTTTSSVVIELRFPLVLPETVVAILSAVVIQEIWAARETLEFALPPSEIAFDPGDGVILTIGGRELSFRITGVQKGETLNMNAEGIDTTIYDALVSGAGSNNNAGVSVVGKSIVRFMDIPLVSGEEPLPWAPRVAAYQGPFPPAVNIYENTGSDLLSLNQLLSPTQMGVLVTPLLAGPHTIIDEGNIIQIDMNDGNFQVLSDTETNVRNGSNAIAVQTSNGDWEIIKFVNAALQSGRRYNLSRLFRGQLGTYPIMEASIPAGQPVVFLDTATIVPLNIPESRRLETINYRYGPNVYPTGSSFYQDLAHLGKAVGQRPYPVADVQFFPQSGAVMFTWKRQTRFGGEGFEEETVPLNEDSERYQIDLLDGSDVLLSTVEVTTPAYTFTGAPSVFKARIYQMSASVGRGRPVTATYGV
jgi:hypothetical protein